MGLYQPSAGAVLIDGIDLRQLEPREYRAAVGYLPQDVTLFHGTLRDNLTLAHRGLSGRITAARCRARRTGGVREPPSPGLRYAHQ
jgi:ABC-type multidrug transport system fused ATPase/permease subunit